MVQDSATQWIQSYPCETKTSRETERSLRKFFELSAEKPKVMDTDNSVEFANLVKIYHGISALLHLINPRRMAMRKERYAEERKGLLLYCCNLAWMKNGGLILRNAIAICAMAKMPDVRTPYQRRFGEPFEGPDILHGAPTW